MQDILTLPKQLQPFSLPKDCHWEENINLDNKNGMIKVYDENDTIYAELNYRNNQLNGLSSFYKSGNILYSITYQNNIANGWAGEFKNDKLHRAVIYENGEIKSELLQKDNSLWEEIDISTKTLLSICAYDESHMRNGIGYIYSNGTLSEIVIFKDNQIIQKMKEINGTEMKEYNDKGDFVYEGGFSKDFKRNGEGKEYSNGMLTYSGCWLDGEKDGMGMSYKNNTVLYQGTWKHNMPFGKGFLLNEDGSILHSGEWINGKLQGTSAYSITYTPSGVKKVANPKAKRDNKKAKSSQAKCILILIQFLVIIGLLIGLILSLSGKKIEEESSSVTVESLEDFTKLSKRIKHLIIPSNSCNSYDFTDFSLEHFANLQTIIIGDNSLQHVSHISLKHLDSLITIEIGKESFGSSDNLGTSMEISRCGLLQNITIDRYSFVSFKKADLIGTLRYYSHM